MEFVVVRCSDGAQRSVFIDAQPSGKTNETLEVQRGTHSFGLCVCDQVGHVKPCSAARYVPIQRRVQVANTISIDPLEIRFERVVRTETAPRSAPVEYVVVRCGDSAQRPAYVDAVERGTTDQILKVEAGTHIFALCDCDEDSHVEDCRAAGYVPVQQRIDVIDTILSRPQEVRFERVEP